MTHTSIQSQLEAIRRAAFVPSLPNFAAILAALRKAHTSAPEDTTSVLLPYARGALEPWPDSQRTLGADALRWLHDASALHLASLARRIDIQRTYLPELVIKALVQLPLPELRSLSLGDRSAFGLLAAQMPQLDELTLGDLPFSQAEGLRLLQESPLLARATRLHLGACAPQVIELLGERLGRLEALSLRHCVLDEEHVTALHQHLSNKTLRALTLTGSSLSPPSVCGRLLTAPGLQALERLELDGVHIDSLPMLLESQIITLAPSCRHLSLRRAGLQQWPALLEALATLPLTALDLNGNALGDHLHSLLTGLGDSALSELKLERCGIDDDHACRAFAKADGLASLQLLDLSHNRIADEGARALVQSAWGRRLKLLDLASNRITSRGARALFSAPFDHLEGLGLGHNPIDDDLAIQIGQPAFEGLLDLDLRGTRVGDPTLEAIAASAAYRDLDRLDLGKTLVTSRGVVALAENARFAGLQHLLLDETRIELDGLRAIQAASWFPSLRSLEIGGCAVDEDDLNQLLLGSGELKALLDKIPHFALPWHQREASDFDALLAEARDVVGEEFVRTDSREELLALLVVYGLCEDMTNGNATEAFRFLQALENWTDAGLFQRQLYPLLATHMRTFPWPVSPPPSWPALLDTPEQTYILSCFSALRERAGRLTPQHAERLGKLEALTNLHTLELAHQPHGVSLVRALARSPHLSSLQVLELDDCRLDEETIVALAEANLPSLIALGLLNNPPPGAAAWEALAAAPWFEQLESLQLDGTPIDAQGVRALAEAPAPRLKGLSMRNCHLDDDAVEAFAAHAHGWDALLALAMDGNRIGDRGAAALASSSLRPQLHGLELWDNQLDLDGARALLKSNPRNAHLVVAGNPADELRGQGSELPLDDNERALSLALGAIESVLQGEPTERGLDDLAEVTGLLQRRLSSIDWAVPGWRRRLQKWPVAMRKAHYAVAEAIASGRSATHFAIADFLYLVGSAEAEGIVESAAAGFLLPFAALGLRSIDLGDEAFIKILKTGGLGQLEFLMLNNCNLSDNALLALARYRWPFALKTLHLSRLERISRVGVLRLLRSPLATSLQTLAVQACALGDEGATQLASLARLNKLEHLHLVDCQLTNKGALSLADSPHLSALQVLDLSYNSQLGDDAIKALIASPLAAGLSSLDLAYTGATRKAALAIGRWADEHTLDSLCLLGSEIGDFGRMVLQDRRDRGLIKNLVV